MAQYLKLDQTASDLAIAFGANVQRRRKELKLSQAELSERTGLATSHLSYIENGKANPTLEVMESLAVGLGIPVITLLTGETSSQTRKN